MILDGWPTCLQPEELLDFCFEILDSCSHEAKLVIARQVKNVPGG
jgi:hypothetical protein